MKHTGFYQRTINSLALVLFLSVAVFSQTPTPTNTPNEDEPVRVSTALIQTGVTVVDKKGAFVNNLTKDDFELLVDGKPVNVTFFNVSGQPSAAQIQPTAKNADSPAIVSNSESLAIRGRTILFLIDDMHLSPESITRTRKMLLNFVEKEKQSDDTVIIVASSGKVGFLQQFSTDDTMLKAAAERLIYTRDYSAKDHDIPPMTEYEAQMISRYDQEVTDKFVQADSSGVKGFNPQPGDTDQLKERVRQRARSILLQAAVVTRNTFEALEQTIRAAGELPGRKTVFLVSDGFLLDTQNTDSSYFMKRITDAAARNNAIIYSLDAKGLDAGFPEDVSNSFRVQASERFEKVDGMFNLAETTGGKLIQNTNDMKAGVSAILDEASHYYLLAWEPESENGESEKFRKIEIKVKNRPELKVRTQDGYLTAITKKSDDKKNVEKKTEAAAKKPIPESEQKLNSALTALVPERTLPTSLVVNYLETPTEGASIAGVVKINGSAVEFVNAADKSSANVDLAGAIFDADGKRQDYFRKLLTIDGKPITSGTMPQTNFYYNFQNKLKPGLYQIRIAARDMKSGRAGGATQWIEIPDLTAHKLALSSLIISERTDKAIPPNAVAESLQATEETSVNADRLYSRRSFLRYIIFIYNAAQKNSGKPEVTVKTTLMRGKTVVLTTPETKVSTDSQDLERLFYGAELPLKNLAPGKYRLSLTIYDQTTKSTVVRTENFEIR